MAETRIVAFLAVIVAVAAVIPWVASQARRRGSERVAHAFETLTALGFVAESTTTPRGRRVVRVWGRLSHPVAFDLRVTGRSRWSRSVGAHSTGMLDPVFEAAFRITTREPERARVILDPEIQRRLLAARGVELRLGSFESLLPREYAVAAGVSDGRRLRRLWMLQVPGTLPKCRDASALGELGLRVAAAVEKHALPPGTPDRAPYETGPAESWI
jgi:hypothetical protein